MPFGQLLMSLASVHSLMNNQPKNNSVYFYNLFSSPPLGDSLAWQYKSLRTFDTQMESNENDQGNVSTVEIATRPFNSSLAKFSKNFESESLSVTWYLASFGALIMFFILISFSEVFCRKIFSESPEEDVEVSPPPYELFAPPPYNSLYEVKKEKKQKRKMNKKIEIFVVPVFSNKASSRI